MRNRFTSYAIIVALLSTLASWSQLARRATGGQSAGNSWHGGSGYSGGGWATGGGGGHK